LGFASTANSKTALTFAGPQDQEPILNYYNGGLRGSGSGPSPNYGITFWALLSRGHSNRSRATNAFSRLLLERANMRVDRIIDRSAPKADDLNVFGDRPGEARRFASDRGHDHGR